MRCRWVAVIALVLPVLGLAACGGSDHQGSSSSTTVSGSASTTTSTASATSSGDPIRHPITTVDDYAEAPGRADHLRVAIYDLRRTGAYLTLDFGIRCVSADCDTQFDFTAPPPRAQENAPDGTTLVDSSQNKQYFPVLDRSGNADVSGLPPDITDHVMHLGYVTFPAPPASVNSLDVLFSDGGPQISGVPISGATAPTAAEVGEGAFSAFAAPFSPTAGTLRLPVRNLRLTVGNATGSESQSQRQTTITLRSDVLFAFDRSRLTPRARSVLRGVAATVRARARGTVQITGYTDAKGSDDVNLPLSLARARAVAAVLTAAAARAPITFRTAGDGANDPVAPNTNADGSDDPAGRALNRRVTISFRARTTAKLVAPPPPPPPAAGATSAARTVSFRAESDAQDVSDYRVTVGGITRSGDLAVLALTVRCSSATTLGNTADACDSEFDFAGTPTSPPAALSVAPKSPDLIYRNANTLSAIYLQDAAGTIYSPVHDADRYPLTANVENLAVGSTYSVWVYFPAPPAATTSITVALPGGAVRVGQVPVPPA